MEQIEILGSYTIYGIACAYLSPRQCCHRQQLLVSIGDLGRVHHTTKAKPWRQCTPLPRTGHSSDRDPEHARCCSVVLLNVHDLIEQ
jgi:hypothetical protein